MTFIPTYCTHITQISTISDVKVSVLSPLMTTLCTLVERCHRFISRSDLQLEKVCLITTTGIDRTLCTGLVNVLPGTISTEHIVDLLTRQLLAVKDLDSGDWELVGTCRAVQPVYTAVCCGYLNGLMPMLVVCKKGSSRKDTHEKHVGAVGAEGQHYGAF